MEDRLKNLNFQNWVKSVLFLDVATSQLRDFVEPIMKQWHQATTIAHPLPTNHTICTFKHAAKCPFGTCDKFKVVVETAHRFGKPTFSNTELQKCWTNPWELAKCYMPYGNRDVQTALETDFPGVVTVILNHIEFQQHVQPQLSAQNNTFYEAKDVRNSTMHNSSFEITSQTLQTNKRVICTTLNALKCPSVLYTLKSIDKIEKDTLALNKASSALTLAIKSLTQLQKELGITIPEIKELGDNLQIEIIKESDKQKQELIKQTSKGKHELEQASSEGVNTIKSETTKGAEIIQGQTSEAAKEVHEKKLEVISALDDKLEVHVQILDDKHKDHEDDLASTANVEKKIIEDEGRRIGEVEQYKLIKKAEIVEKRTKENIDKTAASKLTELQEGADSLNKLRQTVGSDLLKQAEILDDTSKDGLKQLQKVSHTYIELVSNETSKYQDTFRNLQHYIEQVERKIAENIETIQEREKDFTKRADRTIAEFIETTKRKETEYTDEADRKIAENIETIQKKEKDFTERADRKIAEYIGITQKTETEFTEHADGKITEYIELTQKTETELTEQADRKITEYIETIQEKERNVTDHADGRIAEYIEIKQKTDTGFTDEADRKIAENIETIQKKEKDFTERADRKIAEYIGITQKTETKFTEQADRKIAEYIKTIQEKERNVTDHADGRIAEYIEIKQKTDTGFTDEADRKIAENIETIQKREKDFTERTDRKIAEYIGITQKTETKFTEQADRKLVEYIETIQEKETDFTEHADRNKAEFNETFQRKETEFTDKADRKIAENIETIQKKEKEFTEQADSKIAENIETIQEKERDFTEHADGKIAEYIEITQKTETEFTGKMESPDITEGRFDQPTHDDLLYQSSADVDEPTLNKYLGIVKEDYEYVRHIRLMVVGMFGVGKTTIVRRLCNEGVSNVQSTVGIDISACEVDDNNMWKVTDLEAKKNKYYEGRFANAHMKEEETIVINEKYMPESLDVEEQTEDNIPVPNPVKKVKPKGFLKSIRQKFKKLTKSEPTTKKYFDSMKDAVYKNTELGRLEKMITTVSIWDFAGQSMYYSTHHFFLSERAIYLLVLNISQELDAPVLEELENDGLHRATSMPKGFTCRDAFKFWMNSIYTYAAFRKDISKLYRPTIVLVGTFKDVVKEKYEEQCMKDNNFLNKYKEKYFTDALESFTNSEVIKIVHRKKFFVSRDDPAEIFSALKDMLCCISEKQPFWNERVPVKWIPLERSIELRKPVKQTAEASQNITGSLTTNESNAIGAIQRKITLKDVAGNKADDTDNTSESRALMELEELEQIDRDIEFPLADRKQIKLFLRFQHALGNVLYYDSKQLEDTIILDPNWILNVFKLFVAHAREKIPTLLKDWDNYENNAILSSPLIDELVAQADNTTFAGNKGKIIQYMEYLDVIAKPVIYLEYEVEDDSSSDEEDENMTRVKGKLPWENKTKDFYIVPCLLSLKPPEKELKCKIPNNADSTPILCMVFKNDFLPAFVCHSLMATCIRKWEVPPYNRKQLMVFNGMGRFLLNPKKTMWLSLWWKDSIIYMQICLCTNKKKPIYGPKCTKVRQDIKQMIRGIYSIHRNFTGDVGDRQKDEYDEYIKCPKCVEDESKVHVGLESTGLAPEESITETSKMLFVHSFAKEEEVNCDYNHTLGRDAALSMWFSERNEIYKIAKLRHLREEVFNWFRKNPEGDEITELHLAELSEHIGKEYTLLGIDLGLKFKTIEQVVMGEKDIKTCIKKIHLEWEKACQEALTVGHIKSAILKVLGIYLKNGKYREEEISQQKIVKWFESKLGTDMPTERELLEVASFVDGNYKKLRKPLSLSYNKIKRIEEMYSLDFNRTLVVLLQWKKSNKNVSYNTLKDFLVKRWKIDWEDVKAQIEKDEEYRTQQEDDDDDDEDDFDEIIDPEERKEIDKMREIRMQGYKREKGQYFDERDQYMRDDAGSDMDVDESGDNIK